jgi:hypothetical protein
MHIPRGKHTNSECVVDVPDNASIVRVDVGRHHANDRTLWPSADDSATWSIEQGDEEGWRILGTSTTHGGSWSENGVECETSWDETTLRTYRIAVGSWVQYVCNAAGRDLVIKRLAQEGFQAPVVTQLKNRQVRVRLIAHQGPVDTHVSVSCL